MHFLECDEKGRRKIEGKFEASLATVRGGSIQAWAGTAYT